MQTAPLKILISPLDWGLGHATRCVPVIRALLQEGHQLTLAGKGNSLAMLQKEFPSMDSIDLQGFSPSYSRSGTMALHLFLLLPRFIISIVAEHFKLKKLIAIHQFDIIISDNRYGLWNKKIKTILITHQVMVKTPGWLSFAEYPLYLVSRIMISRFDECWIPDTSVAPGLSGDLSHKYPLPANARFIGPLSRFGMYENKGVSVSLNLGITVILSGPEPQRSIFEDLAVSQLTELDLPATIIRGKPHKEQVIEIKGKFKIISHTQADETRAILSASTLVICRSGYSSAMDLAVLGNKALFVPTPGQTEQIYLAELYYSLGKAYFQNQEKLNLKQDIEKAMVYPGLRITNPDSFLAAMAADLKKK